jgi:hypothetical protein
MEGQDFFKIFFQHSTTSLNDVPSRKGGTLGTFCICDLKEEGMHKISRDVKKRL